MSQDRIMNRITLIFPVLCFWLCWPALASDFKIYNVYRALNLGGSEPIPEKDYYINEGTSQGIQEGMVLKVMRKMTLYDLSNEQFYQDILFQIALIKVIHSEPGTSIARLEKTLPPEQTPSISPRVIMIGDIVEFQ